ncbi:MAG: MMPL family transporter [Gordonia sp. (in: high G+C Gram-positive bacteria)]|uniref:MMPL family transporter n=1 Tax=Gordonia sp. (in: high G+C Gram-positive bacteria) TaxID=84139 RepID=UPI0039E6D884
MFGSIGTFVYRMRFTVIVVLIALMGGLGLYGLQLPKYLSQSGWFDPTSESVQGSIIADTALGRDHKSDMLLIITPPDGTSLDDSAFIAKIETIVDDMVKQHPGIISRESPEGPDDHTRAGLIDPFPEGTNGADEAAQQMKRDRMWNKEANKGFISIGIVGNDDTTILNNYKAVEPFFQNLAERYDMPGTKFQTAGLQPVAGAMSHGMDQDIRRAELVAMPIVALMLLFVFGGVVAAVLPVFIGGLTIAGSLGFMTLLAQVTELNVFAQSVVTLIGLGIAIDYGLFMVSRFREELADGYTVEAAVRRSVMTSGQTIVFSATIIVAALACLLMFPQSFLKSVAYGAMASITLAAMLSVTVLPAILAILGRRIDALSLPFLNRTKTREEVINGFWGRLSSWVMRNPVKTAVPTALLLLALIIPFGNIAFGGISEKYLPPSDPHRMAQEDFDRYFPAERTEELKLVILYNQDDENAGEKLESIAAAANEIPGFTKRFSMSADDGGMDGVYEQNGVEYGLTQMSAGLIDRATTAEAIRELRAIEKPDGMLMFVAGTPALTQDSIDSLMTKLPLMAILLVLVTGLLMFLAFGSIILPIKAAVMSALGLGSTLGILTWMFIDGHGSSLLNFTPGPLFSAMLVLIIAIVYGLSTDYEVFLLSRMVEARAQGASTTDAIRDGTALTGRLITAAAAILVVVTGAFGFSNIVMMKYIAFGMIAALILDATVIRMLLVPSIMKLLGDDCWWAPPWMLKLQQKVGLGEKILEDEPEFKEGGSPIIAPGTISAGAVVAVAQAETSVIQAQPHLALKQAGDKSEKRGLLALARRGRKRDDAEPEETADVAPHERPTQKTDRSDEPETPPVEDEAVDGDEDRDDEPALRRGKSGPDTGSWRLGAGGVQLSAPESEPEPAAPQPQAEQPQAPQPQAPQGQAPQPQAPQSQVPQPQAPQGQAPQPQGPHPPGAGTAGPGTASAGPRSGTASAASPGSRPAGSGPAGTTAAAGPSGTASAGTGTARPAAPPPGARSAPAGTRGTGARPAAERHASPAPPADGRASPSGDRSPAAARPGARRRRADGTGGSGTGRASGAAGTRGSPGATGAPAGRGPAGPRPPGSGPAGPRSAGPGSASPGSASPGSARPRPRPAGSESAGPGAAGSARGFGTRPGHTSCAGRSVPRTDPDRAQPDPAAVRPTGRPARPGRRRGPVGRRRSEPPRSTARPQGSDQRPGTAPPQPRPERRRLILSARPGHRIRGARDDV